MTSRCYMTSTSDEGMRLDALMGARGLYASRSAAARAIEEGKVLVSGSPVSKKFSVTAGLPIVYEVEEAAEEAPLVGEPIPLDIRYEDEDLIVLSKQVGLICHPCEEHPDGTLVNALVHHCGFDHLCNVQGEQDRLGIVHRLDMDTSGLMLAAKTDEAGQALMDAIQQRVVDRRYLTLVHGIIAHDTGMIDAPIARHPKDRMRMAVRDAESARDAITTFKVLRRYEAGARDNGYTLVDCKLFTGRTHQIRVHMEYVKHPVVGDPLYVANRPKAEASNMSLRRQFLHSFRLSFEHPITGSQLSFDDNLPDDLEDTLALLEPRIVETTDAGREVFERLAGAPRPSIQGIPYLDLK